MNGPELNIKIDSGRLHARRRVVIYRVGKGPSEVQELAADPNHTRTPKPQVKAIARGNVLILAAFDGPKVDGRALGAAIVRKAAALGWTEYSLSVDRSAGVTRAKYGDVLEGMLLAAGSRDKLQTIAIVGASRPVLQELEQRKTLARAMAFARKLIEMPANHLPPRVLADEAVALAQRLGIEWQVLGPAELQAGNFGLILAVGKGSVEPSRLIVLRYNGRSESRQTDLALVGKGVTFDSGGLDMKPPQGMIKMKYDMSGAAAVLGALFAIAEQRLKRNVLVVIPSAENMPSGHAMRPGDIYTARDGTTVEITNTDAEGRLLLADALHYACESRPRLILDFATLTGAATIVMGWFPVLMSPDDVLSDRVRLEADRAGERSWCLPLWDDYDDLLRSDSADMKNASNVRDAGTIVGGKFLQRFVNRPWVHVDIAPSAWVERAHPYFPRGATGSGIRLAVAVTQKLEKILG